MASLSQGTTVTIAGTVVNATRVVVTNGDNTGNEPRVSVATLGSDPEKEEPYILTWKPYADQNRSKTVQIDFIGASPPASPGPGTVSLSISGPVAFSQACTVVSSSVSAQVADVMRGSITLSFD